MLGGGFKASRCPIGIDLGGRSVKMLQLERTASGFKAIAASRRALPADLPASGPAYHEAVGGAISQMMDDARFVGDHAVSCLPATAVQYKNLRLPMMPADELASAVAWEADERMRTGTDPVTTQFLDAGEVRQGDEARQEVILMAVPEPFVEAHVQTLSDCHLSPLALEVSPTALGRLFADRPGAEHDDTRVVIDVGHHAAKVMIQRGGRVLFFKRIDIGGSTFDKALADRLHLPPDDAHELRANLPATDGESSVDLDSRQRSAQEALRPVIDDLAREIGLCLRYYSVTFRGSRPESALLVGGEAHLPWFSDALTDSAGLRAVIADPFDGIDVSRVTDGLAGPATRGDWAVAIGLSLRPGARTGLRLTPSTRAPGRGVAA